MRFVNETFLPLKSRIYYNDTGERFEILGTVCIALCLSEERPGKAFSIPRSLYLGSPVSKEETEEAVFGFLVFKPRVCGAFCVQQAGFVTRLGGVEATRTAYKRNFILK